MVIKLAEGLSKAEAARQLDAAPSAVVRVEQRYRAFGLEGLYDGRRHNGLRKVDEGFRARLGELVCRQPQDFGWARSTWSRELLCKQMVAEGFPEVAPCTMGRALWELGARLRAARPIVLCPWPRNRRKERIAEIEDLLEHGAEAEPVFYVDEVDIHLNPRIGREWTMPGDRRIVVTPGKNRKHYLAGALDARSGELVWVDGDQKASWLFIKLLWKLAGRTKARRIHLILDNYIIHSSRITQRALADLGGRIQLHFLPPYCPQHNLIEPVWGALHANVTRNHRCRSMPELLVQVFAYLEARNHRHEVMPSLRRAA